MEEGIEPTKNWNLEGEHGTALDVRTETLPSTEFVKVEKNLASLGFFTPSSKRLRNTQEKSFTITTVADGQRLELKGTIIPSAKYGLPITADQDKWIALCKILTDVIRREGRVTNPVSFTSAEILRLLHKYRHSGKNYREVEEWLDVLFSTTIFSEGVVYLARDKRRVKDRFRVFERAVSFGKELPDGKVADKNYVWFSDWQLQNINSNHLLPIDLEAYRELKNHIAKALVPLLQIWLYATRKEGVFEKRYSELCEILNVRQYRYHSLILQTLGPSLDELKQFGYLADWKIEKTSDNEHYKIVFYHGEKFHRDRRARLNRKQISTRPPSGEVRDVPPVNAVSPASSPHTEAQHFDPRLIAEFTSRGVTEDKVRVLLANVKPGQDVVAQLEHAEYLVEQLKNSTTPVRNPAGFIIRLIEKNTPVPDGFETKAQRHAREELVRKEKAAQAAREAEQELEWAYDTYREGEIDRHIAANQATFDALRDTKWREGREKYMFMTESMAKLEARFEISKHVRLLTFEEFLARKQQGTDLSLKPVDYSPSPEAGLTTQASQESAATSEPAKVAPDPSATAEAPPATTATAPGPEPPPEMTEPGLAAPENRGAEENLRDPDADIAPSAPAAIPESAMELSQPATEAAMPEPGIELVSETPPFILPDDSGGDPNQPSLV